MSKPTYELSILTRDGWVFTIVTDQLVSLGGAKVETIIVQPKEDYAAKAAERHPECRIGYTRDANGEPVTNIALGAVPMWWDNHAHKEQKS